MSIGQTEEGRVLDRLIPSDWKHYSKHRLGASSAAPEPVANVERILSVERNYRDEYDQGSEGACVGFSQSWLMSIVNRKLYDARRLYNEAQLIDEWDDTPPAEGTSLRAGFDVLRSTGHWRIYAGKTRAPKLDEGIETNKWTKEIDEIRACIAAGLPVNFGVNWYRQFSKPEQKVRLDDQDKPIVEFGQKRYDYWIGHVPTWGPIDGGHAITCVGASDRRQALALCNTWGYEYPFIVWIPYTAIDRLLGEDGECGIVTDRPKV